MSSIQDYERPVSWLDGELGRQLCPVSAPETLWRRIHEQRRPLRVRPDRRRGWLVAAAGFLVLFTVLVWRLDGSRGSSPDLNTLAARELRGFSDGDERMDILSGDPQEIRKWVRAQSGIDIDLPGNLTSRNAAFRLQGARMIRLDKYSVAAIAYRVGDDFAAMVVTDRPEVFPASVKRSAGHRSLQTKSSEGVRLSSWSAGGRDYAIAIGPSADSQRGCLLCHPYTPALMVFR